ncbi:hypothetical protein JK359_17455 [Streptomyces actinomycinicus]|uniref:Phosphatidylinositol diacylglycerol-lyase n=1 Tax=Streptomyces actinomycinicus TaxID=1695166 RepID=A0A937EIH9_9ACTN|nr:hypothetical protein [Streptomyces actinomycinicus]MBL1083733.1 hypothetical protein [Streptomyces actinomycinicus]
MRRETDGTRLRRSATGLLTLVLAAATLVIGGGQGRAAAAAPTAPAARASAATVDLSRWMGEMHGYLDDQPLNRVAMPGSHDSGSWNIPADPALCTSGWSYKAASLDRRLAASISRTQSGSLTDQLDQGARYLDLRLCLEGGQWRTFHGAPMGGLFFDGATGEAVSVKRWIDQHPSEVVVINVSATAPAGADVKEPLTRLRDLFGSHVADRTGLSPTSAYQDFVKAGKNVVLVDASAAVDQPWAWHADSISDRGSYPASNPTWWDILKSFFNGSPPQQVYDQTLSLNQAALARDPGADAGRFFVLSGIVQPDVQIPQLFLIRLLAPFFPASVRDNYLMYLANGLNSQLVAKLRTDWRAPGPAGHMNIVTIDDLGHRPDGDLQRAVIDINTLPGRSD